MNQFENNRNRSSSAGRSRARGSDISRSTYRSASTSRTGSGARSSSYGRTSSTGRRSTSAYRGQSSRRPGSYRRRKGPDYKWIAIGGVILILVITCIALIWNGNKGKGTENAVDTTQESTQPEMKKEVSVEGITITGMSKSQAKEAILKEFPWSMTVTYGEESYEVTDLMEEKINSLLDEIYSGEPKESYTIDTTGLEEAIKNEAAACASKWNKKAKNGSIDSFDKETNKFKFAGAEDGFAIDEEKLASDIMQALNEKRFDAQIEATGYSVAPEISTEAAKEKYKVISTFTTTTTANKNRNTNVRLSAEAINGTIIKPGHEFSFNETVGQRTEAKGYKGAAAYNNGEVVQEIGGGVCQTSSTLYNAVVRAGLQISYRRSHTFEPNYVTPGQDATVSWDQPDFKFINNSSAAIGLKTSFVDRKLTVSVYGIPILEDGVKLEMESKKVEDLDKPAPVYEEDQTLQPGQEVQKSAGSMGSRWETYKVTYKDGKEISRELDHKTTYKGHAPVIRRNTTGVVLNPEETSTTAETPAPTIDGMPEGYIPGDEVPSEDIPAAPVESSSAPAAESTGAPAVPVPSLAPTSAPSSAETPASTENPGPGGSGTVVVPAKPE